MGTAILDGAIGLIFVYALVSLGCSAISEILEGWLRYRARDLERGVRTLLAPPTAKPDGDGLVARVFDHPLISGLYRGTYQTFAARAKSSVGQLVRLGRGPSLPSYIPGRTFALALLDTIKTSAADQPARTTSPSWPPAGAAGGDPAAELQRLRAAIEADPRLTTVRAALTALVDAAGNDLEKLRKGIEVWFDAAMERVTGWYKRRVQLMLFCIGLGGAAVLNIDTIEIVKVMAADKAVRDSLVSAAGEYAKSDAEMSAARPTGRQPDRAPATPTAPAAPALVADPRPATPSAASEGARAIGVMPTGATPSAPAAARVSCEEQPAHPRCRFEKALLDLRSVDLLPIGWREAAPDEDGHRALALPKDGWDWTARILGWLLTALAASFGAPFWFDLLNKVTTLRSALKPRDKPAAGT